MAYMWLARTREPTLAYFTKEFDGFNKTSEGVHRGFEMDRKSRVAFFISLACTTTTRSGQRWTRGNSGDTASLTALLESLSHQDWTQYDPPIK